MNTDMEITYKINQPVTSDEFIDVLNRSTLGERRPVNDVNRIEKMLEYGNILITAWDGEKLVGVSRALSDFAFCCYLSDLAVDESYQRMGIGKRLVELTQEIAGEKTTLLLLSAPAAREYYPKIGMERFVDCFLIWGKK